MIVPPTISTDPSQSIAFKPAKRGVFGVSMSRKKSMMMNARPSKGTVNKTLAHAEVRQGSRGYLRLM